MIEIVEASPSSVSLIAALEADPAVSKYIVANSPSQHLRNMQDPKQEYLLLFDCGKFVGFVILALDDDAESVELKRIAIKDRGHGLGQEALRLIEAHCLRDHQRTRIWLDVFSENMIAQHIYRKFGYREFGAYKIGERPLLLFQKVLSNYYEGQRS